jgi:hypothetical protein
MTDTVDWRNIKIDKTCWSRNGEYLGKCTHIGVTGKPHDPDPFFKFEKTGDKIFEGLFLKFTIVDYIEEPLTPKLPDIETETPLQFSSPRWIKQNGSFISLSGHNVKSSLMDET